MIEVLKQALKTINNLHNEQSYWWQEVDEYILNDLQKAEIDLQQIIAELESQNIKQVTVKDFVQVVEGKEDLIGRPVYFAQWPNGNTHLPQRTWVGLTDDEIEERQEEFEEIEDMPFSQNDWLWFYTRAIEAKLKEKNT